ncbi:MAG: tetratricopeptide repeat protein [Planctomycetaceae bacterium]
MPFRKPFCLLAMSVVVISAGCSSGRSWKGWNRFLAAGDQAVETDPLAGSKTELSSEFKTAQKSLEEPDKAQLAFARWKEDMGQHAEARQRYQEILTADPDNLSARLGIARIEFATGRASEAQKILQAAAARNPGSAEVWIELGRIQAKRDAWTEAIASFQKATDINATDQVARYELGIAYARAGHLTEAMNHLDYAVGEAAAMYNVGFVLSEQNRMSEAAAWFERSLAAHPDVRTRDQAERMLARAGGNPAMRRVSQSGQSSAFGQPIVQSAAVPQIRPSSSFAPAITPQQGIASSGQASSMFASQASSARQPGIVKQASSSTTVNGIPAATAQYTSDPQAGTTLPVITAQPASMTMPVVRSADHVRSGDVRSADGSSGPAQWNGPQSTSPPVFGNGAATASGNIPVEPEPWRPGR